MEFIVAIVALLVAFIALRYQIITLILSQFTEKAKECNKYLNANLQLDNNIKSVSGVLSSIITAKQILDIHRKKYLIWLLLIRKQTLIDVFHLQLHTSIRSWIGEMEYSELSFSNKIIEQQLKDSKIFLKKSIKKYD
jgi:predicted ATPase with chaperone activity